MKWKKQKTEEKSIGGKKIDTYYVCTWDNHTRKKYSIIYYLGKYLPFKSPIPSPLLSLNDRIKISYSSMCFHQPFSVETCRVINKTHAKIRETFSDERCIMIVKFISLFSRRSSIVQLMEITRFSRVKNDKSASNLYKNRSSICTYSCSG